MVVLQRQLSWEWGQAGAREAEMERKTNPFEPMDPAAA